VVSNGRHELVPIGDKTVVHSGDHLARLDEVSAIELGFPHDFFTKEMVRGFAYGGMRDRIDARPR